MSIKLSMREMLEAGVHFGHQARYWNPKMSPFIYGKRHNIHIINLEETMPMFRSALENIHNVAAKRGKVMFVGTKHAARDVIREEAVRCGMPYVDYRWLGGMLTNYKTIRQSIKRLKELEERLSDEANLIGMTKKEVMNLVRAKDKLYRSLSGIKNMGGLPDLMFVIDVGMEKIAIQEAHRLSIPVIGIADTNADPAGIDYLIPGNDDAVRAIRFYCRTIADVIIAARGEADLIEAKVAAEEKSKKKEIGDEKPKKVVTKKAKARITEIDGEEPEEVSSESAAEKKPATKKAPAKPGVKKKAAAKPASNDGEDVAKGAS